MIKLKSLLEAKHSSNEIVARHATPHKIEGDFKLDKIGSGEGSATFGWGFYFSQNPSVTDAYSKSLARFTLDGEDINLFYKKKKFPSSALDIAFQKNIPIEQAVQEWKQIEPLVTLLSYLISYGDEAGYMMRTKHYTEAEKLMNDLMEKGRLKKTINVYTVELNVTLDNLLDWFSPLKEQGSKVQHLVSTEEMLNMTGETLYHKLKEGLKTKRATSEYLQKRGIDGIKYHDKGSRTAKEGTFNFVIFDPSLIRITDENGVKIRPEQAEKEQSVLKAI